MMNRNFFYILILILLLPQAFVHAQIKVTEDTSNALRSVVVYADPRLNVLLKKHHEARLGVIRSGRGYRVQIYNGNDRAKAINIKIDFMRRFPGIPTYMTYVQPHFRVKVGDYRSRAEAAEMYRQVNNLYSPCMIVPDIIVINTLKND